MENLFLDPKNLPTAFPDINYSAVYVIFLTVIVIGYLTKGVLN